MGRCSMAIGAGQTRDSCICVKNPNEQRFGWHKISPLRHTRGGIDMAKDVIIKASEDRARFDALLAAIPAEMRDGDPLYGVFGRDYYPAVHGERLQEESFALISSAGEAVVVECDVLDGTLGRFGMPILIHSTCAETAVLRRLLRGALKELLCIAAAVHAEAILIADPASHESLSELGLACLAIGGGVRARMHAVVDLSASAEQLHADVRKSAKSLLNWGRSSLELRYCNRADPDLACFASYRSLHARVAGRVTRGEDSWRVMFDAVRDGRGELVTSHLEGELVGGLLVVDGASSCYYASGVSVRERRDLPLAHWPLMNAIERAKQRGVRHFDLGQLSTPGEVTPKELSIAFFKKAFTSLVQLRLEWRIAVTAADRRPARRAAR